MFANPMLDSPKAATLEHANLVQLFIKMIWKSQKAAFLHESGSPRRPHIANPTLYYAIVKRQFFYTGLEGQVCKPYDRFTNGRNPGTCKPCSVVH